MAVYSHLKSGGDWGPCIDPEPLDVGRPSIGGGDLYAPGGPFIMSGGNIPLCGKGRMRPGPKGGPGPSSSLSRSNSTNLQ